MASNVLKWAYPAREIIVVIHLLPQPGGVIERPFNDTIEDVQLRLHRQIHPGNRLIIISHRIHFRVAFDELLPEVDFPSLRAGKQNEQEVRGPKLCGKGRT